MKDIHTLQERIESRCRQRAKVEASRLVNALPYFDDVSIYVAVLKGPSPIFRDHIIRAVTEGVEKTLYVTCVNEECAALLAAVDQVASLTEVTNSLLQSG